ncbi:hypothetical protein TWF718_005182 [Orbilia javanica]|uniref:Uncharacterized protein n=1 Tax=Orbilia javanica TaxID=47235 RepID=A0AAN8N6X0_9PEZI
MMSKKSRIWGFRLGICINTQSPALQMPTRAIAHTTLDALQMIGWSGHRPSAGFRSARRKVWGKGGKHQQHSGGSKYHTRPSYDKPASMEGWEKVGDKAD